MALLVDTDRSTAIGTIGMWASDNPAPHSTIALAASATSTGCRPGSARIGWEGWMVGGEPALRQRRSVMAKNADLCCIAVKTPMIGTMPGMLGKGVRIGGC
mgnify:CR=1 FL=1